jgi:hypothetical protein
MFYENLRFFKGWVRCCFYPLGWVHEVILSRCVLIVMATLLHFLRSLSVTLLAGFLVAMCGLGSLLGALIVLSESPLAWVSAPVYAQLSWFLAAFGGGDRLEGMVAIALTVGFVAALLSGFSACKRNQRSEWRLAAARFDHS